MGNFRICHVITRLIQGGADENTIYSCNGQVEYGHKVYLIVGYEFEVGMLDLLDERVKVIRLTQLRREISPFCDLIILFRLFKLFRKIDPDIVHTHTSKAGIIGRFAAYISGVKAVVHGVHILPFDNVGFLEKYIYLFLERLAALRTEAFVSVSQALKDYCIGCQIGKPRNHFVVSSGMDIKKFRAAGNEVYDWRQVLEGHVINSRNPRFITIVSRLEERKGQLKFLPIFKKINQQFPDTVLLLVGNGKDYNKLSEKIVKIELEGKVVLTGLRRDVEKLISISEICLLTSEREGLPRVLIQYLSVGKPIVTTDCIGIEKIIKNGVNGYVMTHKSMSTAMYPIQNLLKNKDLQTSMLKANKKIDLEQWNIDRMVQDLENIYQLISPSEPNKDLSVLDSHDNSDSIEVKFNQVAK